MASKKKSSRPRLLSSTRPRNARPTPSLSSQTVRALVRTHHTLRKQLSTAVAQGDYRTTERLKAEIEASGGLNMYQEASIIGQSAERGGDTSKVLMEWLLGATSSERLIEAHYKLRMLEVGALKIDNACSRSGLFEMKRIDLHSQHPHIEEQDFMQMQSPRPENQGEQGYDLVSLSLVVNFVGDPTQRGDMLRRVGSFLRPYTGGPDELAECAPALFLVLPAPCVTNSRYLDEGRLESIMESIGYRRAKRKLSSKLIYYLWKYEPQDSDMPRVFKKEQLRSGGSRNNFAIVLR
ncbi:hypothetical protein JMJ35_005009 [Cladonia borealis]|uniref:25S rRNA adenine-N(1) methyltransferase n=1 Tax=Cladonia borealis TaxID=184061 RepID=A0AA39R150_9LECA|nr:hypothetical protein JMJ35_005009 [Cladonia borealis]